MPVVNSLLTKQQYQLASRVLTNENKGDA